MCSQSKKHGASWKNSANYTKVSIIIIMTIYISPSRGDDVMPRAEMLMVAPLCFQSEEDERASWADGVEEAGQQDELRRGESRFTGCSWLDGGNWFGQALLL